MSLSEEDIYKRKKHKNSPNYLVVNKKSCIFGQF